MSKEPLRNSPDHQKGERAYQICIQHPKIERNERRKFNALLDTAAAEFDFIRYGISATSISYTLKDDNLQKATDAINAVGGVLCEQIRDGNISLIDWVRRPYVLEILLENVTMDTQNNVLLKQIIKKYSGKIYWQNMQDNDAVIEYQFLFNSPQGGNKELAKSAQRDIGGLPSKQYVALRNDLFPSDFPILNFKCQELMEKRLKSQTSLNTPRLKVKV